MMRFSNLRNAVLAFMLAFTAACSTGGDTTPAGPGSDNTTGDASVAACCTVNPSNSQVVDLTSPTGTVLAPYNAGTGTVSFDGSLSTQIGTSSSLTDVSRIMILLDENPNAGVSYEYIVADSGHMFDATASNLTSDPDNSQFATETFSVLTPAGSDIITTAANFTAGSLQVTITDATTGALLGYCAPPAAAAGLTDCQDIEGGGAGNELQIDPTTAVNMFTLTYNDGGLYAGGGQTITVTYRDAGAAADALGASGNNGISISGVRTFKGELLSSGATADGNNCQSPPGTLVNAGDLTTNVAGLDAAILLDDGVAASAATLAGARWGIDDVGASGIFAPCTGIVIRSGGASGRSWTTASPIPVGTATTATFKVVFLNSNDEMLGQSPLFAAGTSTTVRADATLGNAVASSPFLSNLFVSSDTAAPAITDGDLVAANNGVLTTGLRQQPLPMAGVSWIEVNDDLAVGPLSTGVTTASQNLRASNVQAGDVVTISEGDNLGAVVNLGMLNATGNDLSNVSPSRHSTTDPIINSASGVTYEIFHASAGVTREREGAGALLCTVSAGAGVDNLCEVDGAGPNPFNIARADDVSVQGTVSDGVAGSDIATIRVTGTNTTSGEEVEQTTVVSRDKTRATHEYAVDANNNILLVRRGSGDDTTNDCYEVVAGGAVGDPAVTIPGLCGSGSGGDLISVQLSGLTVVPELALTDNTDSAPPHLDGGTSEVVNAINIGRPASEEITTDGAAARIRLTTVRRGADAADTKLVLADALGVAAGDESDPALGDYSVTVAEASATNITVTVELPNVRLNSGLPCDATNCPTAATVEGVVDAINNDTQASQFVFAQILTDTNTLVTAGTVETVYPSLQLVTESIGTGNGVATAFGPVTLASVADQTQLGAIINVGGAFFCEDVMTVDGDFSNEACGLNAVSVYDGGGGQDVTLTFAAAPPNGAAITITYFVDSPAPGPYGLQTNFFPLADDGAAAAPFSNTDAIFVTNNNGGEVCSEAVPTSGILTCNAGGSGVIDYTTGEITVTFGSNVDVANGVNIEYAHTGAVPEIPGPNTIGTDQALGINETDLFAAEASPVTDPTTGVRAALFNGEDGSTPAVVTAAPAEVDFDGGTNCAVSGSGCPAVTATAPGRISSSNPKVKVGIFDSVNGYCLPSFLNPAGQTGQPEVCFSAQMPLTEGSTSYEVIASDVAGNAPTAATAWGTSVARDTTPAFLDTDAGTSPSAATNVNTGVCESPEFDTMPICVMPADVNLSGQIETFATTVSIGGKVRDFVAGTTVYDATGVFPNGGESGRAYVRVTTDTPVTAGGANYDSFNNGSTTDNFGVGGNPIPYVNGDAGNDQGLFNYNSIPLRVGGVTNVKVTIWDQAGNITEFSTQITQISTATTTPPSIAIDCVVEDQPRSAGGTVVPCQQDVQSNNPNTPAHVRLGTFGDSSENAPVAQLQQITDFVVYTNDGESANAAVVTGDVTYCNASHGACGGQTEGPDATFFVLDDGLATVRLETAANALIEECIDDGNGAGTAGDGTFTANAECRDATGATTTGFGTVAYGVAPGANDWEVTFQTAAVATDVLVFEFTRDTLLDPIVNGDLDMNLAAVVGLVGNDIYLDGSFTVSTLGQSSGTDEVCTDSVNVTVGGSVFTDLGECGYAAGAVIYTSGGESLDAPEFASSLSRGGSIRVSFSADNLQRSFTNNFNTSLPIAGSYAGGTALVDNTTIGANDEDNIVIGLVAAAGNTVSGYIPGAPLVPGSIEIIVDPLGGGQNVLCDNGVGGWANPTNRTDCTAALGVPFDANDMDDTVCAPFGAGTCVIDYSTGAFTVEVANPLAGGEAIIVNAMNTSRFGVNLTPPIDLRVVSSDRVSFRGRFLTLDNAQPTLYINETPGLTASSLPAHGAMAGVPAYSFGFVAETTSGGGGTNQFVIPTQTIPATGTVIGLPIDLPTTPKDEAIRVGDYITLTSSSAAVAANQGLYRITAIGDGTAVDADDNCQNTLDNDGDGFLEADSDPCILISVDRELPAAITGVNTMFVQAEYTWFTPAPLELENEGINSFVFLAEDSFGNRRSTAYTVLRDFQPPSIVIQGVIDGFAARTITPEVFITDASLFMGGVIPTPDALRPTPATPTNPATFIAVSRLDANGFDAFDDPYETGYALFADDIDAGLTPNVAFDISNDTGNNARFGVPRGDGAAGGVADWPATADINAGGSDPAPLLAPATVLGTARGKGQTDGVIPADALDGDPSCNTATACPAGQPISYRIEVQAADRGGLDSMLVANADVVESAVGSMLEGALGLVSGNPAIVRLLSDTTNLRTLTLDQLSLSGVLYNLNLGTAQLLGSPGQDAADNPQAFFYINNGARDSFGLLLGTILEDPDGDPTAGDAATAVTLSNVVRILADNGVLDDLLPILDNPNILNPQAALNPGSTVPASQRKGDMSRSQTFMRNLLVDTDAAYVSTCGYDQRDLDQSGNPIAPGVQNQQCFSQEGIIKEAFPAIQATLDFGRIDEDSAAGSSPRIRATGTTSASSRITGEALDLLTTAGFAEDTTDLAAATPLTVPSFLAIDATDAGGGADCNTLYGAGTPFTQANSGTACLSPVNVQPGDIVMIRSGQCPGVSRRVANYAAAGARNSIELAEAFPAVCVNDCNGDCEYEISAPNGPALNPIVELVDLLAFGMPGNDYDLQEDGSNDTLGGENELLGALFHLAEGGFANDPTFFASNGLNGMATRSLVCPAVNGVDGGAACTAATDPSRIDDAESLQAVMDLLTEIFDDDDDTNGQELMTRVISILQILLTDGAPDNEELVPANASGTTVLEALIPILTDLLDDGQDRKDHTPAINDIGGLLTAPATDAASPLGAGALDGTGVLPALDARRNTRLNLLLRSTWWLTAPLCAASGDGFPNGTGACGLQTHVDLNGDGMGADGLSQRVSILGEEIGEYSTDRVLVAALPLIREIVNDPDDNPRGIFLPGSSVSPNIVPLQPGSNPQRSIAERLLDPVDVMLNDSRLSTILNDLGALLDPGTGISDLTAFDKVGPVGISVLQTYDVALGVAGVGPHASALGSPVAPNGLARVYNDDTAEECTDIDSDGVFNPAVDNTATTPCTVAAGTIDYSDGSVSVTFTVGLAAASNVYLDYGPGTDANPFTVNPPLLRILSQISSEEIDANVTPGDATDDVPATESLTSILNILLTPIGPELGAPSTNDVNVDNDGVPVDTAVAHEGFFAGRTPAEILLDIVAQMLERSEKDPRDYDVAERTLPDHDGNSATDINANRTLLRIILDGVFDDPNVDDPSLNDQIDDYPGNPCADHNYDDVTAGAAGVEPTCPVAFGGTTNSGTRGPLGGDNIAVPQRALDILPELLNTMARFGFDTTNTLDGEPLTTIFENCDSTTVGETCPANNGYPDDVAFSGNHRLLSNARTGIDIALQLDQPLQVGAGNVCGEGLLCFEESLLREAIESISNMANARAVDELLLLMSKIEEDIAPINMSTSIPNPEDVSRAASAVRALADPDGDGVSANDGLLGDLIPLIQVIPASGQTQQIIDLLRAVRGAGYDNSTDPARDIRGGELLKAQEDVLLSMLDAYSGATDELSADGGTGECPAFGGPLAIGATGGILDSVPAGLNTISTKGVLLGADTGATTGAGVFVDETKDFAALGVGPGAHLCIRTVINPFTETCALIDAQPVGDTITFNNAAIEDIDTYLGANCQATTAVVGENFVGVGNGTTTTTPGTLTLANGNVEFGSITVDWTDGSGARSETQNPVTGNFPAGIDNANTVIDYINGEITLVFLAGSEPIAGPSDISLDYTVVNPDRCSYRVRMMREPFNGCRGGEEMSSYDPLTNASPGVLDNPGMGKSLSSFQTGAGNGGIIAADINAFKDSRLDLLLRAINDLADGRVNATDDDDAGATQLIVGGDPNPVLDYNLSFRLERLLNSLAKDDPNTGEQSLVKTLLFGTGGVQANEEGPVQALLNDDEARASLTATLSLFGRLTTLPPNPVGGTNAESAFDRYPTFETTGGAGWPEVTANTPCNGSAFPAGDTCDGNAIHDAIDYQFLALKGILDVLGTADGQDGVPCGVFTLTPNNDSPDTIQDEHCDDPDVLFFIVSQFKQLGLIKGILPGVQVILEATNATGNEPPLDGTNSCGTTPGDNSGPTSTGFFRAGCLESDFNFRDLRSNRVRGHQTQIDRDALADIIQRTVFSGNGDYAILSCVDADADCDMNLEDPATSTTYPEDFAPIDRPAGVLVTTDGVLEGANQVLIRGVYQSLLEYLGEDTNAVVTANEVNDQLGYGTRRNRFVALEELLARLAGTPGSFGDLSQALRIVRGIAVDKRNDEQSDARDTGSGILAGEFGDDPTGSDPEGNTQRDIGPILSVNAGLSSRGTVSAANPYQSALDIVGDFLFTLLRDPTDCDEATVAIERNVEDIVAPFQPLACPARDAAGYVGNANNSEDTDSVFRDVGVTQERPIQPILNEAVFESLSALFAGDDQAIIVQALPFLGAFLNESIGPVLQRNGDFLEYDYCDTDLGPCLLTEDTIADALLADLQTLIPADDFDRLNPMLTDDLNRNGEIGAGTLTGFGTSSPINDLDGDCTGLQEADNRVVNCYQGTDETGGVDVLTSNDWGDNAAGACGATDVVATPVRCADPDPEVFRSIGFTSTDGVITVAQIDGLDAAFFDGLADLIANEDTANAVNNQSNRTSTASQFDTFTFRNVDSTQAVDPNFINLLTSLGELLVQTNQ